MATFTMALVKESDPERLDVFAFWVQKNIVKKKRLLDASIDVSQMSPDVGSGLGSYLEKIRP